MLVRQLNSDNVGWSGKRCETGRESKKQTEKRKTDRNRRKKKEEHNGITKW